MKYYKIQFGYDEDSYLPIKGDELHKAIALFVEKNGRGVFEKGAIRGQDIMRIVPDWHTAKGWNKGWKMTPDDYADIAPLEESYQRMYNKAKDIAEFAIKNNRRDLLEKSATEALQFLPPPTEKAKEIIEGSKALADKMSLG